MPKSLISKGSVYSAVQLSWLWHTSLGLVPLPDCSSSCQRFHGFDIFNILYLWVISCNDLSGFLHFQALHTGIVYPHGICSWWLSETTGEFMIPSLTFASLMTLKAVPCGWHCQFGCKFMVESDPLSHITCSFCIQLFSRSRQKSRRSFMSRTSARILLCIGITISSDLKISCSHSNQVSNRQRGVWSKVKR